MEIINGDVRTPLNLAISARNEAESDISTSYIFCKCEPDYLSAVPNFEKAAKYYNAGRSYREEIYCREQLIICHRNLKDTYSEGVNYERIANLYASYLDCFEDAYKNVQNAHLAYKAKGDYKYEVTCLINLAAIYREKGQINYAEKCLKVAYDDVVGIPHAITLDKNCSYDYVYKALDKYSVILILQNKFELMINEVEYFVRSYEPHEDKKYNIILLYGLMSIAMIFTNRGDKIENFLSEAERLCQDSSDYDIIKHINNVWTTIKDKDEYKFNMALKILDVTFDNELTKKLKAYFDNTTKQGDKIIPKNFNTNNSNSYYSVNTDSSQKQLSEALL